jgi:hypothetical protein
MMVEDLTDEQLNHIRRFLGLPRFTASELASWRGYLQWMARRFRSSCPAASDYMRGLQPLQRLHVALFCEWG